MSELPQAGTLTLAPHSSRQSTSCEKHPADHFTAFCPSCLCDRLAALDPKSSAATKLPLITTSTTAANLKAIFKPFSAASSSSFSHLRRTKSFSSCKNDGIPVLLEPQRKSCDVRVRSTLSSLFSRDDNVSWIAEVDPPRISSSSIPLTAFEEQGFVLQNHFARRNEEIVEVENEGIQVVVEPEKFLKNLPCVEEPDGLRLMESGYQVKKRDFKDIAGSFWSAASVFSKRLQKWRQKQKAKKHTRAETINREKILAGKQTLRETVSEVADYGYGRRSCDVDPRVSFEDQPRYSLDAPRASWDGYLMPGRISSSTFTKMPTMSEDCPITNNINGIVDSQRNGDTVARSDWQIPVEFDEIPGGTVQTREYYMDTSSRRKRSVDRSNSIRKTASAVVAEIDALKNARNGKMSLDLRDSFASKEECSSTCELDGKFGGDIRAKKSWWRIWGFMQRRKEDRGNSLTERSMSGTWEDLRTVGNAEFRCAGESSRKRTERYSTTRIDGGTLKLYVTPVRGSRRRRDKSSYHSPAMARTIARMY